MKNTICIVPADKEMEIFAEAVSILNTFKLAGYDTRKDFIMVVCDLLPQYCTPDNQDKLRGFWAARVKDGQLNADLQLILKTLKK